MLEKNYQKIILILFILGILIRLFGINQAGYDDELDYLASSQTDNYYGLNNVVYHPPLSVWFTTLVTGLFGANTYVMRISFMLLFLLTTYLIYLLAKKFYDKKAALIAVFLMLFSFYGILASLQIDMEGSLITFFYTFAFFSFIKYQENKNKLWYLLTAVICGLALLTKESSILLIGILYVYSLTSDKIKFSNISKKTLNFIPLGLIALSIFAVYPLLNYLSPVNYTEGVSANILQNIFPTISFEGIAMLLFWVGPLLLGLGLLSLTRYDKKDKLFYIWIFVILVWYIFMIKLGDHSRYYMNLIPAFSILGGKYLSRIKFNKKQIYLCISLFILFLGFLFYINLQPLDYVPRDIGIYKDSLLSFKTDTAFSFTTSSGPLFITNLMGVVISLLISFLFLGLYLTKGNKIFLIAFLAIALAFNIFLVQEYLFNTTQASPGDVINEMLEYEANAPVYLNNAGLMFYFDNKYPETITKEDPDIYYTGVYGEEIDDKLRQAINTKGGTALILNYPILDQDNEIWKTFENCELVKTIDSKNIKLGYIYDC